MTDVAGYGDTRRAYEAFGISRESGLGADYIAWAQKRTRSLSSEMGYNRAEGVHAIRSVKPVRTTAEQYDDQWERKGWYKTIRAAEIEKVNPLWLSYACHVGLIPHQSNREELFSEKYRVRLEDVRIWMKGLSGTGGRFG